MHGVLSKSITSKEQIPIVKNYSVKNIILPEDVL